MSRDERRDDHYEEDAPTTTALNPMAPATFSTQNSTLLSEGAEIRVLNQLTPQHSTHYRNPMAGLLQEKRKKAEIAETVLNPIAVATSEASEEQILTKKSSEIFFDVLTLSENGASEERTPTATVTADTVNSSTLGHSRAMRR